MTHLSGGRVPPGPPRAPTLVLVAALTGNIASGKSVVARRLVEHGAVLIDADVLAREVVARGMPALAEIAQRWGAGVLDEEGALDRAALRRIVFASPAEREALNAIVHPHVAARRDVLLAHARAEGARIAVCDIPLLFETGMESRFDVVILVHASEATRRDRLVTLRGLAPDEAERMIAAQLPSGSMRSRADIVIENDGTVEELLVRVDAAWEELLRRAERMMSNRSVS